MTLRPPPSIPCGNCNFIEYSQIGPQFLFRELWRGNGDCVRSGSTCVGSHRCAIGLQVFNPIYGGGTWYNFANRGCTQFIFGGILVMQIDALGDQCDGNLSIGLDGQNNNEPLIVRWYRSQNDCIAGTNSNASSKIYIRCGNCASPG